MNIGITLSKQAYTPEAYAYEKYLSKLGHSIQLDYNLDGNNDINIHFMGLRPFWKKKKGNAKEIHEYQSLSTPPYAKFKNFGKKLLNNKPNGRIFLNNTVYKNMGFKDRVPYVYRDMGVDKKLFQMPRINPKYDVIYCGSISGRRGLIEILLNIAKSYKVIVVGKVSEDEKKILSVKNITLLGVVGREELSEIYRDARFGLNFTPDLYPYNVQTSTKTLEYLASGLGVISNKYEWSMNFFKKIHYQPIWIEDHTLESNFLDCKIVVNSDVIKNYSWDNVLSDSNLEVFLREVLHD